MTLFGEAFDKEHEPSDASFWRRELVAAIEQLPRTQTSREDLPPFREVGNSKRSEKDVRSDIREGNYEFKGVKGLVSLTSWSSTDSGDSTETRGGRFNSLTRLKQGGSFSSLRQVNLATSLSALMARSPTLSSISPIPLARSIWLRELKIQRRRLSQNEPVTT